MKRWYVGLLSGLMAATALAATPASAQTPAPAKLRPVHFISSDPTLTSAMVYIVKSKGFDKAHGIDIDITRTGNSSTLQIDAVVAGQATFGAPGTLTALQAIREGADLRIIASISNNQLAAVLSNDAMKKAGIPPTAPIADRIRAMKGMTIAVNPVGATYYQMFRAYLKQYGINPDNDVKLVPLGDPTAMLTGLGYGRYDAMVTASGIVEQAIGLKTAQLWFNGARGDLPDADSTLVCIVVARGDTVEKHPEDVDAMRAALADALKYVRDEHDAAGKMLKTEYFPKFDPEVWEVVWNTATNAFPTNLSFSEKAFKYWVENDPKGAESYKHIEYKKVAYGPVQTN